MFAKILIANRGEIACRVIRTAKAMGIGTVAVFSEADRRARHVALADEAVPIGPAPAAQSYLDVETIVRAALDSGADALHPGYGFLSENPAFVRALDGAGVTFIGPGPEAIAAMGDKLAAKRIAADAGVSVIPGHPETLGDVDEAARVAREIGYPVMLKAAAGGGGKGMRIAADDEALREGFARAESEARAAFGDSRIFLEKYVPQPRHIEIQVLADGRGNAIHLGERECSIQRRHQKIIEEAPSTAPDEAARAAMAEQALALVRAVDYRSAGTVEFILDPDGRFYFLEMNTRLQVEHPVTELVTGIDLVEEMIHIAAGAPLRVRQEAVKTRGWAIEARIYAEDPERGFLPSSGRLRRYRPPEGEGLRLDSGVIEGDEISVFYDPMMAKLCAHGADRDQAIERLRAGLDRFAIQGVDHNLRVLNAVLGHERFAAGRLSTDFLAEVFPDGGKALAPPPETEALLIGVAAVVHTREQARTSRPPILRDAGLRTAPQDENGDAAPRAAPQDEVNIPPHAEEARRAVSKQGALAAVDGVALAGDRRFDLRIAPVAGAYALTVAGIELRIETGWALGARLFEGTLGGRAFAAQIDRLAVGYRVSHGGFSIEVAIHHPRVAELAALMPAKPPPDTGKFLLSPMPGLVVALAVHEGEEVKAGQPLAVVDAMKMENVLRAARDGVIAKIRAGQGASVSVGEIILEFE